MGLSSCNLFWGLYQLKFEGNYFISIKKSFDEREIIHGVIY